MVRGFSIVKVDNPACPGFIDRTRRDKGVARNSLRTTIGWPTERKISQKPNRQTRGRLDTEEMLNFISSRSAEAPSQEGWRLGGDPQGSSSAKRSAFGSVGP